MPLSDFHWGLLKHLAGQNPGGPVDTLASSLERLLDDPRHLPDAEAAVLSHGTALATALRGHYAAVAVAPAAQPFPCGAGRKWENYVGTESITPDEIACPQSLDSLRAALARAAASGHGARAAGSHHAWSDAALCAGIVIETAGLSGPLGDVDPALLRNPGDAATLKLVPAGTTIKDINTALDAQNLALINMGGYDGQTLAGVISTSTHGSGIALTAFPGFVEALIVLRGDGSIMRIERAVGVTDPAKYAASGPAIPLVQDDKLFNASVVGIGCLGVIYAVVLRVWPQYWLSETRTRWSWAGLKPQLRDAAIIRQYRHVEVLVNPYPVGGEQTCLLTLRREVPRPEVPPAPKPFRNLFGEFLAGVPGTGDFLAWLFRSFPSLTPSLVQQAILSLEDGNEFVAKSFEMLNIGAANGFPAVCSELGVDLDRHVDAVDAVLATAAAARDDGIWHSGTIALRYVAPTPGFLTMQSRETCMIELPMMRDVPGSQELFPSYETALTAGFAARPHWGQTNFLSSLDEIARLFGANNLSQWRDVFATFNPHGEFHSPFTQRVGLS